MQAKNILLLLLAGAAGYLILRRYNVSAPSSVPASSPVVPVVEEVLHQHQGEDTPMVHAFEAALEEERRHDEQLAHDVGVRA